VAGYYRYIDTALQKGPGCLSPWLKKHLSAGRNEARFRRGLAAKVDVSVRLAQVFAQDDLEFTLFFSSLQAFTRSPGQSNYAAGC
jgi:hypothetical protein